MGIVCGLVVSFYLVFRSMGNYNFVALFKPFSDEILQKLRQTLQETFHFKKVASVLRAGYIEG